MEQETARQQANPYAAPKAVLEDVGLEALYDPAGRRRRLGAAFVDSMIFLLLADRRCVHDLIADTIVIKAR